MHVVYIRSIRLSVLNLSSDFLVFNLIVAIIAAYHQDDPCHAVCKKIGTAVAFDYRHWLIHESLMTETVGNADRRVVSTAGLQ